MKNTADFHYKIKVCISKVTVSEKNTPFPTYGGTSPQISACCPSSTSTHWAVQQGLVLRCPASRHLVPAGDAGQACSEGKQRAPPGCRGTCQKPTSRKYQAFCYRHCHFFFSILIVHLFRGFRRLRNTNPNCSLAFVSFHILVLVYCWTNGAQQIIMQNTHDIFYLKRSFSQRCAHHVLLVRPQAITLVSNWSTTSRQWDPLPVFSFGKS